MAEKMVAKRVALCREFLTVSETTSWAFMFVSVGLKYNSVVYCPEGDTVIRVSRNGTREISTGSVLSRVNFSDGWNELTNV